MNVALGKSIQRKDAWDKVTGKAKYTDDFPTTGTLCARLLTSTYAHARIISIDTREAIKLKGVESVLTGKDCPELFGPLVLDRPALAQYVVRYAGEPVAMVVAIDEKTAAYAVDLIKVEYEELKINLTPSQSLSPGAQLIHQKSNGYKKVLTDIYPEEGTNTASRYKIRKGNVDEAFKSCDYIVHKKFNIPPSDHLAMEVRTSRAEISSDGNVMIITSSQGPYTIVKQISEAFLIPAGKIQVKVPYVGGAFGGKAPVTLEILAFLASRSVGGKSVRVIIPREQDLASAPCKIGMEAEIKIGANKYGKIQAAELTYWLDSGAYTDITPYMTKAVAVDCTGPYHIENLSCDSLCVYTNHTYATSYRSFAHESCTFCIERAIDMLAHKCSIDPLEFRLINAIHPGSTTPTQVVCDNSLTGDLTQCLNNVKLLSQWDGGKAVKIKENTVKVKGVSCFWKTENPPTDAISGAFISFNNDGSVNLNTGVVEIGAGGLTHLSQILAEGLKIDPEQVHVVMSVDTMVAPEHWKTVASMSEYLAGHAVMRAVDDIINQLKSIGSQVLNAPAEEIEISNGRVFSIKNPENYIEFKDIAKGYQTSDGDSVGDPVLGRGGFMLKGLSLLNPQTGQGKTGPAWTLGAQVVEIEADIKSFTYRVINASTVIDVGKVINPELMRSMVAGGMAMGVSLACDEAFSYNGKGIPQTPNLRTYKILHIGQEPDYRVNFIETPEGASPFGLRNYCEHGIIGILAAIGNALSIAFNKQICNMPLTSQMIWQTKEDE